MFKKKHLIESIIDVFRGHEDVKVSLRKLLNMTKPSIRVDESSSRVFLA